MVTYHSTGAPDLEIYLPGIRVTVQFVDGVYETDDPAIVERLDRSAHCVRAGFGATYTRTPVVVTAADDDENGNIVVRDDTAPSGFILAPFSAPDVSALTSEVAVLKEAPLNLQRPEFGAAGDGTTDDTAAIQEMYDYGQTAVTPAFYIPPGIYVTDGNQCPADAHVFGDGPGKSVLKLADNAPQQSGMPHAHRCILSHKNSTTTGFDGLIIEKLELDGNVLNNNVDQQTHGIETWGGSNITIRDIYAHHFRACGIFLAASAGASPILTDGGLIENIRLYDCGNTNGGAYSGTLWQGVAGVHMRRVTWRKIYGELIGSNVVDLETDNSAQYIDDCVVEDIYGDGADNLVAIYGRSGGMCNRNTIRGLRGNNLDQLCVILDYCNETLIDDLMVATKPAGGYILNPATNTNTRTRNVPGEYLALTRTASQTGIAATTATAVEWDSEVSDPHGQHDQTSSTTRRQLLAVSPGVYQVTANLRFSSTAGTYRQCWIRKNGTDALSLEQKPPAPNFQIFSFLPVKLNAGDYLEVIVQHDAGAAIDLVLDAPYAPTVGMTKVA